MGRVIRSKVVLVGDPAVGKSALCQMLQSGGKRFPKNYQMTCGADLAVKMIPVQGTSEQVELHLFDSAGQDIFAEMLPKFWQDAAGVILVFDVTRKHTLEAFFFLVGSVPFLTVPLFCRHGTVFCSANMETPSIRPLFRGHCELNSPLGV